MLDGAGVVVRVVWLVVTGVVTLGATSASGQSTSTVTDAYVPTMTFDVASVRESKVNLQGGITVRGGFDPPDSGHLHVENWSLANLVTDAYSSPSARLHFNDIDAGDSRREVWMTYFNIDAKADAETEAKLAKLTKDQVRAEQRHMLQALLEDRLKLKVHWEDREKPAYDLVVAKRGRLVSTGAPPTEEELKQFAGRPIPSWYQRGNSMRGFEYIGHGATTAEIAEMLTGQFEQPVRDKTGLTGKYDFHLKTYGVKAEDRKMDETNPWPSLENAVEDELGLKLVRSKGMVKTLVIDHWERPGEN